MQIIHSPLTGIDDRIRKSQWSSIFYQQPPAIIAEGWNEDVSKLFCRYVIV